MIRKLLFAAIAASLVLAVGCRHRCLRKDDCCPRSGSVSPGARSPILLPPAGVPTTPGPVPSVGPSNFPPPSFDPPLPGPAPKSGGPELLFPDPLPGGMSSRPTQPGAPGVLGTPVRPATVEPPKVNAPSGLSGYTKVKEGLFAGRKPTIDGFDALNTAKFRTVVYLHKAGADVDVVKEMASSRSLGFVAIETTPETLADATTQFNRVASERTHAPVYVFGDDDQRAGAVWYLHFRIADSLGDDVARIRAKALGLSEQGDEGRAFALAIQRVLETR
jgi:hypothetical protein